MAKVPFDVRVTNCSVTYRGYQGKTHRVGTSCLPEYVYSKNNNNRAAGACGTRCAFLRRRPRYTAPRAETESREVRPVGLVVEADTARAKRGWWWWGGRKEWRQPSRGEAGSGGEGRLDPVDGDRVSPATRELQNQGLGGVSKYPVGARVGWGQRGTHAVRTEEDVR